MQNNSKLLNKSFLIGMISTIAILAIGYGVWWLLRQGGVEFSVIAPKEIKAGEIQTITFAYKNGMRVNLENAEIIVSLPDNIYAPNEPNNKIIHINVGIIEKNTSATKTLELIAIGEKNTIVSFDTSFRYKPVTLTSVFEKKIKTDMGIYGSAIGLNIDMPTQILPDTNFDIKISWENQSNMDFSNLRLNMTYPEGYILNESSITPLESNNIFDLGDIGPNAQGFITLNGYITGQGGENKKFTTTIGTYNDATKTFLPITTLDSFASLVANPLMLGVTINDEVAGAVNAGDMLNVSIKYQNNYQVGIQSLVLKVVLEGDMFDYTTLSTNKGYFSAKNRTITWTESQIPQLAVLNPGETGIINFNIKLKDNFVIKNYNDKNFIVEVKASLESKVPLTGMEQNIYAKTSSSAMAKLNTKVDLITTIFYRDLNSNITNCGTLPLKVDTPTCFTVHWLIKNYTNNLNNVKITTTLPMGVEYTGKYSGNYGGVGPSYDPISRQITWTLSNIASGSGIISKAYELIFQISATPTIQQQNSNMTLLNESVLTAEDAFTQNTIQTKSNGFFSNTLTDKTVGPMDGIVR